MPAPRDSQPRKGTSALPAVLFAGLAVASIGGPLALPSFFPGTAGSAVSSAGLVAVLSVLVFCAPLAIWLSFARRVSSPGGLSAFVAEAAGRRLAMVHGWIWALAYFLYLPYTVTFVVYDVLAPVFPGLAPYRSSLELLLPVALVAISLAPVRWSVGLLALVGLAQLALLGLLAAVELRHVSAPLVGAPRLHPVGAAVGSTALFFVCASLPLYLSAEVSGGARTVRRSIAGAVALVGAAFVVAVAPLARVPAGLRDAAVPAEAIARAYDGRTLGAVVGAFSAASALALIVAEYLALARLLHWLHGPSLRSAGIGIAVPFVAADALSLIDPSAFYDDLLKPSLGALFVSQLVVFAVYPRFRRGASAYAVAAVASGLAAWGLYTLVSGAGAS